MDGTLAVGDPKGKSFSLLPGVTETFAHLKARGIPVLVFTNGTANPPGYYAANLSVAGLELEPEQMLTPSSVAADLFLREQFQRILVLGVEGVSQPLVDAGLTVTRPGDTAAGRADAIYIGWHPEFTLADITAAAAAIEGGAPMYVSSNVPFFFTRNGRTHGISRIIAAGITSVTGVRPRTIGKPSPVSARFAAKCLGCALHHVAVVGDDPRLEAEMANSSGAYSIGVTTGLTSREAWAAQPRRRQARIVLDRLDEILSHIGG